MDKLIVYLDSIVIQRSQLIFATSNFSDKNIIKQTSYSKLYKGELIESGESVPVQVVVWRLTQKNVFLMALKISANLKHKNILRMFKVVDDQEEAAYPIYIYEVNQSLDKHLSDYSTLTWMRRLHICVGVARALSHIHNNWSESESIIHGNIKTSKILLDHNWEPKLHVFGTAMEVKKHQLYHTSSYDCALQYMDPAYEKTKALSHKSDVFSFGIVLFEVLLGRVASIPISTKDEDNWSFARFARSQYKQGTLYDMIDPDLRQHMDMQSFKSFSEIAYNCLQEQRSQRSDMIRVVKKLERALDLQKKHESHEPSTTAAEVESPVSSQLKGENLERLKIPLSDVMSATNNFSETCRIGKGGYGSVYKAVMLVCDGNNVSPTDEVNKDEVPNRHINTVAIKRIFDRVDNQGEHGFLSEIEMLSKCKHQNVVSLFGFCCEDSEMVLIYEYVSNGSLEDYLGDNDKPVNLTWAQRMQISLDIAHGLKYLHTSTKDKPTIIHRDIKSANILLDDNWVAKIGDFGLSKLNDTNQQSRTLVTSTIAGTSLYLDPEYSSTGKLNKKSDVYSFGVVLFEIMCGRLAHDNIYISNNEKGLPSITRRRYKEGTLKEMVDPNIIEADENNFMLYGGLNQDSLDTYSRIAYQCLEETQAKRPTMEVVIEELEKAILFQKNSKDNLHISLGEITFATENFSDDKCIEEGRYWKQYEGKIPRADTSANHEHTSTVIVKRFDSMSEEGPQRFLTEIKVLVEFKHKNIVSLVGYCAEMGERIIVYEHASNGRLNKYVQDASLTWMQRINICIDVARGLAFLQKGGVTGEDDKAMIHGDIKSGSILLDAEWNAKISNLELASSKWKPEKWKHDGDDYGSLGFLDPTREDYVTQESDMYSLGVLLLEMFSGRFAWELEPLSFYKDRYGRCDPTDLINQVAFEGIKEQISANSCDKLFSVALYCGAYKGNRAVIEKLEEALQAQEDHEIWEPKLPRDYKEILESSKIEARTHSKKGLYELLYNKGVLLKKGHAFFSLGSNGEKNEMISARNFSFINSGLYKWRSTPQSRFPKVAKIFTISNLKINIKVRTRFLSPGINYGVHLVFKFFGPRKSSNKSLYVNLKYKMGNEIFHSYFATWRDEDWMMVELYRILDHKKDTNFEAILENFSGYYCGVDGMYIEGIEFRGIHDVNNEEIVKIKEVRQVLESNTVMVQVQQPATHDSEEISDRSEKDGHGEKVLSENEVNEKKHLMLPAVEVVYDYFNGKRFDSKPSEDPRFQEVVELLPQQVFSIKCKISSQKLLPDTNYMCYLVFKLSEKCHGLHCPVKVRDVLHWKDKETVILYFRTPSPWNLHDNHRVPEKREDGWMEVLVWRFNSTSELRKDCIPMHLKLITYEGTMSGLTVGSLEVRPM